MKDIVKNERQAYFLGIAIGLGVGIGATVLYYSQTAMILKAAKWTPQGDMILSFYHRTNHILLPSPKVP